MLSPWYGHASGRILALVMVASLLATLVTAADKSSGASVKQEPSVMSTASAGQKPTSTSKADAGQDLSGASMVGAGQESTSASTADAGQDQSSNPRCRHPLCIHHSSFLYKIEGTNVGIHFDNLMMELHCYEKSSVLDSTALPSFEPALYVQKVKLGNCDLPAARSLLDVLVTLNLTFCEQDGLDDMCELQLEDFSATRALTPRHFAGLERIQILTIRCLYNTYLAPERDFLTPLRNLRSLTIICDALPADMEPLPRSLDTLNLKFIKMKVLPDAISFSSTLRELSVSGVRPLDVGEVPLRVQRLELVSPGTALRLQVAPALNSLRIFNWLELLPKPLTRCTSLRKIYLHKPMMIALPAGWLAKCFRLEELQIARAEWLTILTPLFSPDVKVTTLSLTEGALEMLPEELKDLVYLQTLDLKRNRLKQLPRGIFTQNRYHLSKVDLSFNNLDNSVLEELGMQPAPLWGSPKLIDLDLSNNPSIGDFCGADGYSPIRKLSEMRRLILAETGITRICRDWRENMPKLAELNLRKSKISNLSYDDLMYIREVPAEVALDGAPLVAVRMTRDDFNKATLAPRSRTYVHIDAHLKCDCAMYWTRRVLDQPLALLALPSFHELRCAGGGLLREISPEELTCPASEQCAVAALPSDCECVKCPDDDPRQDRWLVRMRCENSSMELVPRTIYPFYPIHESNGEGLYYLLNFTASN